MICREFIRKVEEVPLSELGRDTDVQLLAHELECPGCAGWLQQRYALAGALQVLRSSSAEAEAPSIVEQNVLRAFRQSAAPATVAETKPLPTAFAFRLSRFFEIGAYAAAAAALAISLGLGALYWQHQQKSTNNAAQHNTTMQPGSATAQQQSAQVPTQVLPARPPQQAGSPVEVSMNSQAANSVPLLTAAQQAQGYTPMMLCDPLSCSGDEQVVRMELPASDSSQGSQMADVIIGDDGLVRAIRIVQQ